MIWVVPAVFGIVAGYFGSQIIKEIIRHRRWEKAMALSHQSIENAKKAIMAGNGEAFEFYAQQASERLDKVPD
jgi:hypothetical protein